MPTRNFSQNYFQLFDIPAQFEIDATLLGQRYRQLQQELHPDRFAAAAAHEQRLAVQYSAFVNEAYATLRAPLKRALYLLELGGMTQEEIARQQLDGGFLIEQMELREKLESLHDLVDPDTVLEHLVAEISGDIKVHQAEFETAYQASELPAAASACVKMQYLEKLLQEAEQIESELMER
ncbi:Fe-S protein assembly co-chaperone HscB [Pseudohalioglobus lutimaris]|uniref:Co-chaperone protein HscB homolog n=1 Tax=Pseudohalioglobus lutimaris TaxID=1737061 RepID=A0A2N5X6W7_9GAMM|nr:Fe-S protein assembly co-chaperone HscB [Pseudohalioglobus lutimaris]PLW70222.1 Fe-S protein assembly co-chaperone HscB [Pseudohalioglobus lutimaris]